MGPEPRSNMLLDTDEWAVIATRTRKPFKFYLRQTPATPLSAGTKAILWAAGAVVVALLVVVLVRGAWAAPPRKAPRSRTDVGVLEKSRTNGLSDRTSQVPNSGRRAESWA